MRGVGSAMKRAVVSSFPVNYRGRGHEANADIQRIGMNWKRRRQRRISMIETRRRRKRVRHQLRHRPRH